MCAPRLPVPCAGCVVVCPERRVAGGVVPPERTAFLVSAQLSGVPIMDIMLSSTFGARPGALPHRAPRRRRGGRFGLPRRRLSTARQVTTAPRATPGRSGLVAVADFTG
ncbi:hypothetical protein GCM10023222_44380 [Saccharopolyspora cebuensis]